MDTEDITPTWSDLYTPEQWAAILETHADLLAKKFGEYSLHSDLRYAAECIRELVGERDALRTAGGDIVRKLLASRESLSKLPS